MIFVYGFPALGYLHFSEIIECVIVNLSIGSSSRHAVMACFIVHHYVRRYAARHACYIPVVGRTLIRHDRSIAIWVVKYEWQRIYRRQQKKNEANTYRRCVFIVNIHICERINLERANSVEVELTFFGSKACKRGGNSRC